MMLKFVPGHACVCTHKLLSTVDQQTCWYKNSRQLLGFLGNLKRAGSSSNRLVQLMDLARRGPVLASCARPATLRSIPKACAGSGHALSKEAQGVSMTWQR